MKPYVVILACGCWLGTAAVHADDVSQRDLDAQLSAMAREDPDSPAVIEARLERVGTLLQSSDGCEGRLTAAQAAIKDANSSPALPVVLPLGPARLASLEYELHRARARCAAGHDSADTELHAALAAAQRSADLYREGLDYASMAIMQFNVAVTQRSLGDSNAALAALTTAVSMDHEYGLTDDARDNERLLAQWRPKAEGPQAASLQNPQQKRSAALHFTWGASDADEQIEFTSSFLVGGKFAHATATRKMLRQVRPSFIDTDWGWRVSYQTIETVKGEAIGYPTGQRMYGLVFPTIQAMLELPTIDVRSTGELRGYMDLGPLTLQLLGGAAATFTGHAPPWNGQFGDSLGDEFTPESVAGRALENYGLETEAWIGATLEQGVWYHMTAGLSVPGLTDTALPHDIEFAYTRNVPCMPGDPARNCVEIVVHATPQAAALDQLLGRLGGFFHTTRYWSTSYVRLTTDPRTLTPYGLDVRRYWHIFGRPESRNVPESGMERVVKTYRYLTSASTQPPLAGKSPAP